MCEDTHAKLLSLKAVVAKLESELGRALEQENENLRIYEREREKVSALTQERDAARHAIVKLWPAFPVGSNYVLDAADKVAIVAALQAVRKE